MCERNIICTNNTSLSLSSLFQVIVTIPHPPYFLLCSLIPLYFLYILTRSQALGVKGTVLYNCSVELGVYD